MSRISWRWLDLRSVQFTLYIYIANIRMRGASANGKPALNPNGHACVGNTSAQYNRSIPVILLLRCSVKQTFRSQRSASTVQSASSFEFQFFFPLSPLFSFCFSLLFFGRSCVFFFHFIQFFPQPLNVRIYYQILHTYEIFIRALALIKCRKWFVVRRL